MMPLIVKIILICFITKQILCASLEINPLSSLKNDYDLDFNPWLNEDSKKDSTEEDSTVNVLDLTLENNDTSLMKPYINYLQKHTQNLTELKKSLIDILCMTNPALDQNSLSNLSIEKIIKISNQILLNKKQIKTDKGLDQQHMNSDKASSTTENYNINERHVLKLIKLYGISTVDIMLNSLAYG